MVESDTGEWSDRQLLVIKLGLSLIVVLLTSVWYCWNRFQVCLCRIQWGIHNEAENQVFLIFAYFNISQSRKMREIKLKLGHERQNKFWN